MSENEEPDIPASGDDSLEELQGRPGTKSSAVVDVDPDEEFELPGDEVIDAELTVAVIPQQADEFRCTRCFLVRHRSQMARDGDSPECKECAE